jgi:hypothetical protein
MYPRTNTGTTISSWIRDVVYLRPDLFIVYDRTTVTHPTVGQWMRFHFAGVPIRATDPSPGVTRYDIGSMATYAGTVTSVLPIGHQEQVAPTIFTGSNVSRLDVRPGTPAIDNRWLTVFDAAATAAEAAHARRLSTDDRNVLAGAVVGVLLQSSVGNYAVLSGTGAAATTITPPIRYRLAATVTLNVITDLAPSTAYTVKATPDSRETVVDITRNSGPPTNQTIQTSQAGVLSFSTSPKKADDLSVS